MNEKIQKLIDALHEALEEEEKWGSEGDLVDGMVIRWQRHFGRSTGIVYTYAAVWSGNRWYTTGQYDVPFSHQGLIEEHLSESVAEGFEPRIMIPGMPFANFIKEHQERR